MEVVFKGLCRVKVTVKILKMSTDTGNLFFNLRTGSLQIERSN